MEGRELAGEKQENAVLEFKSSPPQDMLIVRVVEMDWP
jgi:hypothetical protein